MEVFDTTYLIDAVNGDGGAAKKAMQVTDTATTAAISVITAHEYLYGVYRRYRNNEGMLRSRLADARQDLNDFEILPLTAEIAELSSRIEADLFSKGSTIGLNDIYIAATALYYNAKLVTRNTSHFRRIKGLEVETY